MSTATPESTPSSSTRKPGLPQGMVMGPDGKPCKICTSFRNWRPATTADAQQPQTGTVKSTPGSSRLKPKATEPVFVAAMAGVSGAGAAVDELPTAIGQQGEMEYRGDKPPPDCPPDVEILGNATWTFLHTTAAHFPQKPTPTQRAHMLSLLRSLPVVYPCTWCAQDLGNDMAENVPDVSSGSKLSEWLCMRHNEVNKKLGKPIFDCAKVAERWKDGPKNGRCD